MRKIQILELIYPIIQIILFIVFLTLSFFFDQNEILFYGSLIGMVIPAVGSILKPFKEEKVDLSKRTETVKELYDIILDLLSYLESKKYWNNLEIKDEKINTIITYFRNEKKLMTKYFGYNIINEERNRYDKVITLLSGDYKLSFRNRHPYNCEISKRGLKTGFERLFRGEGSAILIKDQLLSDIKTYLKEKYDIKV